MMSIDELSHIVVEGIATEVTVVVDCLQALINIVVME